MQKTILFILLLLSGLACRKAEVPYSTLNGQAQGTTFNIQFHDRERRDFSTSIDSIFRLIDKSMSLWDSTSLIRRINRNETDARPDEHFTFVFNKAQEVSEMTDGAFDVTVSPLVKAWGFSYKKGLPPPDSIAIDSLKKLIGFRKVSMKDGRIFKEDPSMELDFNAIAQGYTVDLISGFLEARGITNYLVEIGGEVRANGANERDSIWVIGIDMPINIKDERPLQTTVALKNKSLATSGNYRKFIEREGKILSHVIDPGTGYPAQHNLLSVSVIADDCTEADAYATAFMVLGLEKAMEKATELKMEIYCIYAGENGELMIMATPGFGK